MMQTVSGEELYTAKRDIQNCARKKKMERNVGLGPCHSTHIIPD